MEKLRLFVAIPMPETVRNEIIRFQHELQGLVPSDAIRWTKPEQFHLTLRFLGDVPAERVAALQEAIHAVCRDSPALCLRVQGIGFFRSAQSPRVIWIGVSDDEGRLVDLQKRIETTIQSFSPEKGTEKFAGHVTIGRVKILKRPEIGNLAAHAEAVKDRLFGEWTANKVELIRSELSPNGANHTVLAAFHLAACKK